jgi:Arm DNA-binding domain
MTNKLTARKVETAKSGKYSDGGNLYLIVSGTGARKWVLRFTWRGRAKEMGLGSAASVPLADAREKAASARRKIAQGLPAWKPLSQMARLLLSATLFCKSCSQVIFDTSIVTCA